MHFWWPDLGVKRYKQWAGRLCSTHDHAIDRPYLSGPLPSPFASLCEKSLHSDLSRNAFVIQFIASCEVPNAFLIASEEKS